MAAVEGIKNATELKGGLNGLKTILAAALIVLSGQLEVLQNLLPVYPDSTVLELLMGYADQGIDYIQTAIAWIANPMLAVGSVHKVVKSNLFTWVWDLVTFWKK